MLLNLDNVSFSYGGQQTLANISFSVDSGENTVLITEFAGEEPECIAAAAATPIISTTSTPTNILNVLDL